MAGQQLKLEIPAPQPPPDARRNTRLTRSAWWFAQMHHVVDAAVDWCILHPPQQELLWADSLENKKAA